MLALTHASLATVEELFAYKSQGMELDEFPGYTRDQWGIKAHNRPWIEDAGQFSNGQKIIEVGGAYSSLPKYLAEKYDLEAWVGDDFGMESKDQLWSRWGDPKLLSKKYPSVKYVYEPFGNFSDKYPQNYFDCIYSVSTLEHIPYQYRLNVLKDMNRCLKTGGHQLHAIDISTRNVGETLSAAIIERMPLLKRLSSLYSGIMSWIELFKASGVKVKTSIPNPIQLLNRQILIESPDVIYRFVPPNNSAKPYRPTASLKLIIKDC